MAISDFLARVILSWGLAGVVLALLLASLPAGILIERLMNWRKNDE